MLFNSTNPSTLKFGYDYFQHENAYLKKLYLNKEGVAVLPKGVAGKMDKSKLQISM